MSLFSRYKADSLFKNVTEGLDALFTFNSRRLGIARDSFLERFPGWGALFAFLTTHPPFSSYSDILIAYVQVLASSLNNLFYVSVKDDLVVGAVSLLRIFTRNPFLLGDILAAIRITSPNLPINLDPLVFLNFCVWEDCNYQNSDKFFWKAALVEREYSDEEILLFLKCFFLVHCMVVYCFAESLSPNILREHVVPLSHLYVFGEAGFLNGTRV